MSTEFVSDIFEVSNYLCTLSKQLSTTDELYKRTHNIDKKVVTTTNVIAHKISEVGTSQIAELTTDHGLDDAQATVHS